MLLEVLLVFAALFLYYYWTFRSRTSYWKERGIPSPEKCPFPLGNNPIFGDSNIHLNDAVVKLYEEFKGERFYGTYTMISAKPLLVITDLDLAQRILSMSDCMFALYPAYLD